MTSPCEHNTAPTLWIDLEPEAQFGLLAAWGQAREEWADASLPAQASLEDWHTFLSENGENSVIQPRFFIVTESLAPATQGSAWAELWTERLNRSQGDPRLWLKDGLTDVAIPPSLQSSQTLAVSAPVSALLGALACPPVATRTHRQGIVVVYAGHTHVTAFLVFKERVYGVYTHRADQERMQFQQDLNEFKRTWLPDEVVRKNGGTGSAFIRPVPDEAESFEPVYLFGPRQAALVGYGQHACGIAPQGFGHQRADRLIRYTGVIKILYS